MTLFVRSAEVRNSSCSYYLSNSSTVFAENTVNMDYCKFEEMKLKQLKICCSLRLSGFKMFSLFPGLRDRLPLLLFM